MIRQISKLLSVVTGAPRQFTEVEKAAAAAWNRPNKPGRKQRDAARAKRLTRIHRRRNYRPRKASQR